MDRSRELNGVEPWRFPVRSVAVRLFVTCWIVYALHFATNIVREIYPALTLGDHLSFDVSEYAGLHPDIFEMENRGAFINNNPGASIVGAVPYVLARPLVDRVVEAVRRQRAANPQTQPATYESPWPMARRFYKQVRDRGLDVKFGLAAGIMQSLAMAPLSALSAVVIFRILLPLTSSVRAALALALLYAFATPIFYRTAQLNQNLLVSHCGLFAFALLWRPWDDRTTPRRPYYFWAGLLAGWAVVCDYSGIIVLIVLALYGLSRRAALPPASRSPRDPWLFLGGALLSGCVLMGYQWTSFGHPLWPAQHYMPPANFTEQGYRGFDLPQADLLWATAFNIRYGLFTSAPLLLLALFVPAWWRRWGRLVERRELFCILGITLAFFIFCSANQYGRMQFNTGVRHVVPVTPFLFLLVAGVLMRMPATVATVVGVLGTYWSWCLAMYRDVELGRGVLESLLHVTLGGLRFPWLTTLERMGPPFDAYAGNTSAIPLLLVLAAVLWALWGTGAEPSRSHR